MAHFASIDSTISFNTNLHDSKNSRIIGLSKKFFFALLLKYKNLGNYFYIRSKKLPDEGFC